MFSTYRRIPRRARLSRSEILILLAFVFASFASLATAIILQPSCPGGLGS